MALRNVGLSDSFPLETVGHETHIGSALGVIESGKIRAQRIVSDSKLTKERIRAVWVSPNVWSQSVYGNVRFTLDFKRLIADGYCYLVEQPQFQIPTYRFLITQRKFSNLTCYRSTEMSGPWWQDQTTGGYIYNCNTTIQFVIDRDVDANDLVGTAFVDHARANCANSRDRKCESGNWLAQQGGARFFAAAVANDVDLSTVQHTLMANQKFTPNVQSALDQLQREISQRSSFEGAVTFANSTAVPLGRAVLSAFGCGRDADCFARAGLFKSKRDFRKAIFAVLATQIGVENLRGVAFRWDEEN
ncbi:hypothetical protein [Pandoraea apista]|uniref:hypothetical protein n=1 Tax=Pandoraea apista TaxID=93218 RepID=UPI00248D9EFF|nr:hypothetical protein [Pandoraea apista]